MKILLNKSFAHVVSFKRDQFPKWYDFGHTLLCHLGENKGCGRFVEQKAHA